MKVFYSFDVKSSCPIDNKGDHYEFTVESDRAIDVEAIKMLIEDLESMERYQEYLTDHAARALRSKVVSVGWHSGVRVECHCP